MPPAPTEPSGVPPFSDRPGQGAEAPSDAGVTTNPATATPTSGTPPAKDEAAPIQGKSPEARTGEDAAAGVPGQIAGGGKGNDSSKGNDSTEGGGGARLPPVPGRRNIVRREMLLAVFITLVVFAAEILIEKTDFGQWTTVQAFNLLERVLPARPGRLSVVVVDISAFKGGLDVDTPTDREQLMAAIDALHSVGAVAVGVDVDFSGTSHGWLQRSGNVTDPEFFQHCLEVSPNMPVFLGVYRTRNKPSAYWLGLPQFKSLAVNLAAAETQKYETLARVQKQLANSDGEKPLPGLGYALAKQLKGTDLPEQPEALTPFLEPLDDSEGQLVNFSQVDKLESESMLSDNPVEMIKVSRPRLEGRVVLLGAINPDDKHFSRDYFYVPGHDSPDDQIAGPFYHASAAYTFTEKPLYEFNAPTRAALDITLSLIFLVAVGARARYAARHPVHETLTVVIEAAALVVALVLLGWIAIFCMRELQIVWLDSLLVAGGLIIHYGAAPFVKGTFPDWFKKSEGE